MKTIKWLEYGIKDKAARDQLEDKLYKDNSVHIPKHPEHDGVFVVQVMGDKWKSNKFAKAYGSFLKSDKPRKTIKQKSIFEGYIMSESKRMQQLAGVGLIVEGKTFDKSLREVRALFEKMDGQLYSILNTPGDEYSKKEQDKAMKALNAMEKAIDTLEDFV